MKSREARAIDYETPLYRLSDAARAADVPVNTVRSYYQRGDFRIVGGEDKKGQGIAAKLTLPDVMCIVVACRLIEVGIRAKTAFNIGVSFAYFKDKERAPSQMSRAGLFTILICYPTSGGGEARIVATNNGLDFAEIFTVTGHRGRLSPVLLLLNDVERRVFWALRLGEPDYTLPEAESSSQTEAREDELPKAGEGGAA